MPSPIVNNRFLPRSGPPGGGSGDGPWVEVGGVVQLTDVSWDVVIGDTVMVGTERLRVVGDARVEGKLTVTGSLDPTDLQLTGGTALFISSTDGSTAPVSAAGSGRLRYNQGLTRWEKSENGGAYVAMSGAATAPGGANTNVQFNNAGAFGGDAGFTYDSAGGVRVGASLDLTAAGLLSIGGAIATTILIGSALTQTGVVMIDNTAGAFQVREAANLYIDIDTANTAERIALGNTLTAIAINLRDNANSVLQILEGGNSYLTVNSLDGSEAMSYGYSAVAHTFNIRDNAATAFRILEGANSYITINTTNAAEAMSYGNTTTTHTFAVRDNVAASFGIAQAGNNQLSFNTTNFSEDITFGNSTTNPDYLFNGTGILTVGGSGGAGRVNATTFGPGAFDAAHAISIADLSTSTALNFGNTTSNPPFAFLGTGTVTFGASQARIFPADGDTVLGAVAMAGTERLRVVGDARVEGKLTVTGSLDPTDLQLTGGTALFISSTDGSTAPVSAAGSGRLRYNNSTTQWEASVNGGAYAALGGAATDIPIADNVANAFQVREAANDYIDINTTDGAEVISLGNAVTNPAVSILGSSAVRLTVGGAGAGELDVTTIRPNPGGGGHAINIATAGINTVVTIGQTGSNTTVGGALNVGNPTGTTTGELRTQADILVGGNLDKPTAAALNLGTGTANSVVISKSGILTDVKGSFIVRQAFTSEGNFLAGGVNDTFDVITGGIANAFTVGGGSGADYININDTGGSQTITLGLPAGTGSCPVRVRGGNAGAVFDMDQRTTDPASASNRGQIYVKDVAGTTQLFFQRDDGTQVQLT